MAKAIDIGTSFIVGAEVKDGREVFTIERDAFFSMPKEDFAEEMLNDARAYYLSKGDQLYVVGEDALKFAMLTGNAKSYRRPMARGVLNPGEEEAISMLELLIEGILGRAAYPGEVCAATVPAEPIDADADPTFHRIVIERCLSRLGYEPKIINEALAIIYHENPQATVEGEVAPFTGVGMSFGAGMTNVVVAWRAKKLFEMAVARGGDWIDERVASVRGTNSSKVCSIKERKFDLRKVEKKDAIQVGLEIYYEELIRYVLSELASRFKTTESVVDEPLEVVIAGGTCLVPGFMDRFKDALQSIEPELPFKVKGVRQAPDALRAVAAGALVAAISFEKKKQQVPVAAQVAAAAGAGGAGERGGPASAAFLGTRTEAVLGDTASVLLRGSSVGAAVPIGSGNGQMAKK